MIYLKESIKIWAPLGQHAEEAEGYYVFPKLTGPLGSRMMFNGKEINQLVH